MWAFPFGAGLALFGADLVHFVLGDEWDGAVVLLGGLAVATALQQLGYNWFSFYRARGESRPQAVESGAFAGSFPAFAVPGALLWGSWGFVAGRLACTVVRARRAARSTCGGCCPASACGARGARRAAGASPPAVPVLALRLALWGGERPPAQALAELALWLAALVLATRRLERGLLGELWGYLRSGSAGRRALVSAVHRAACGAALARGGADLGLHDAALPRAVRRGAAAAGATRIADGQWPYADFGWALRARPAAAGRARVQGVRAVGAVVAGRCAWRPTPRSRCSCGRWSGARPGRGGRWRPGSPRRSPIAQPTSGEPGAGRARARPWRRWRSRSAGAAPAAPRRRGRRARRRWPRSGAPTSARRRRGRGRARARRARAARAALGRAPPPRCGAGGCGALRAVRRRGRARRGCGTRSWPRPPRDGALWRLPFPLGYDGPLRAWPPGRWPRTSRTCSATTCR